MAVEILVSGQPKFASSGAETVGMANRGSIPRANYFDRAVMSDTPIYGQCVHGNNLATCVHCRYGDNNTMMSGTQIMKVLEGRDARLSSTEADVVIGYKLTRADCSGWMFCGTTPSEVAECVKNELDMHDGLSPDECGGITIEAYETTQAEIDNLPEFQGW